ncbi:MAG: hypothetical protein R6V83_06140 [Candidatus Thorarchaeota archaeon]
MGETPIKMIEKYLERVRVYLPVGSEDTLREMRTHLIEEAERLGDGKLTHGSAMLAVERFGDPKDAANAYAGTGKKVGPVPKEYVPPLLRIALALIALGAAFAVASYIVGFAIPGLGNVMVFPYNVAVMVIISLIYAFAIIGGLSLLDRGRMPTEKTFLEKAFGIGAGVFKPKSRWESAGEAVMGVVFAIVLLHPAIQLLFPDSFLVFLYAGIVLVMLDALKGLLFFLYGENNINLVIQALVAVGWVILALFLINVPWPVEQVYAFDGELNLWILMTLEELDTLMGNELNLSLVTNIFWVFTVFVIVIANMWEVLISVMKVPMYLEAGKGWWWKETRPGMPSWWPFQENDVRTEEIPESEPDSSRSANENQ